MTNISRNYTNTHLYQETYENLLKVMAKLDQNKADLFFRSLFTEAEQVMFTKRFAAYLLFTQKNTSYEVARKIGLSISTAQRLREEYEKNDFCIFFDQLPKKQQNGLIDLLSDIIMAQVSPKARARVYKRALGS